MDHFVCLTVSQRFNKWSETPGPIVLNYFFNREKTNLHSKHTIIIIFNNNIKKKNNNIIQDNSTHADLDLV